MKLTQISLLGLALAASPLASYAGLDVNVAIGGPEIVIRSQPPAERIEVIPASPGPDFIWIRGHWSPMPPPAQVEVIGAVPYAGAVWVRGHWAWRPYLGRYAWVPGHWQAAY